MHALIKELAIRRIEHRSKIYSNESKHLTEGTEVARLRRRFSFVLQQALPFRTRHQLCRQRVALAGTRQLRSPGLVSVHVYCTEEVISSERREESNGHRNGVEVEIGGKNGVGVGNGDGNGDVDEDGVGTRTGVEARGRTQDKNKDGSGDGVGTGAGTRPESRGRTQDGNADGSGGGNEGRNGNRKEDGSGNGDGIGDGKGNENGEERGGGGGLWYPPRYKRSRVGNSTIPHAASSLLTGSGTCQSQ